MRLLVAVLIVSSLATAQGPEAILVTTSHDFGAVRQGEKISHVFTLRNAGKAPLRIQGVDLNLPGLKALFQPNVAPGGEATIKIEWNTAYVEGLMEGQAIVRTNDPAHGKIFFGFKALVTAPVQILPLPAAFFTVFEGETSEQTLQIINHEDTLLGIQRIELEGQHFAARIETVTPGKVFRLHVKVPSGVTPGRYMEAVSLYTDRPERPTIRVPVNVLVKAELYVDPEAIDFGKVPLQTVNRSPGILRLLTQTITIQKRQGVFEIRAIESDLGALEMEKTPTGSSNAFRVDIRLVRAKLQPGTLTGTIRIHTTDKKFPQLEIPVRGEFQ